MIERHNHSSIDEGYVRFLGSYFFASGHDREDIEQEARCGWICAEPGWERRVARNRVLDLVKVANRRALVPLSVDRDEEEVDLFSDPYDLFEHVAAREELRRLLDEVREVERVAVGRRMRGEPIPRSEKTLQSAFVRYQRRVAA